MLCFLSAKGGYAAIEKLLCGGIMMFLCILKMSSQYVAYV